MCHTGSESLRLSCEHTEISFKSLWNSLTNECACAALHSVTYGPRVPEEPSGPRTQSGLCGEAAEFEHSATLSSR